MIPRLPEAGAFSGIDRVWGIRDEPMPAATDRQRIIITIQDRNLHGWLRSAAPNKERLEKILIDSDVSPLQAIKSRLDIRRIQN
jgi:hypothetical protein